MTDLRHPGLPVPQRYHAMAVILLGIAVSVLDGMIVNLALPGIVRDLQSTPSHAVWVVNAYQLATLALLLPLASLGDRVGYRRVYLVGVAVFTAASAVCSLADSLPLLAAARALQGAGAAGLMAVNAALVRLTYPTEQLGRGIAINSVTVATASVAGPPIAAAVLSHASWPWLFAVNVPLGIVLLALGARVLPHNPPASHQPARLSAADVLLNAAMFCLLFLGADVLGARAGGTDRTGLLLGLALLAGAVVAGVVHVRRQLRRPVPLLPVDLLRIPIFRLSMGTSLCAFAAQTLAYIALPFLLLDAWHLSAGRAGLLMACWPAGVIAAASLAGRLIGRYPGGLLGAIGLATLSLGLGLLGAAAGTDAVGTVWWQMALCGLGFGLFQSPNNHTIITSAPAHRSGAASGMLGTARLTGQSLGAVCVAAVFAFAGAHRGAGPQAAIVLACVFAGAGAVFSGLRVRHA
ncbi:MAG TPA: MFS transporter [Ramlibacter sp.]|jgi:DHA2 family multidrug resistance protein-like MFS transporter|uniref:MFS transporter n=1 Tax=Ramlibacter sp. TaxID=1917967 RepID=UPI002D4AA9DF|nr:MFS transporter [Ramlibacter sp.]HZY17692.1 MFS transporter [Ramlibacter sp.]